jgi:predicted DNA-binding protein (UPF0251 family)
MRFFDDLNQSAIAARIGYSQMHVSRLLRRALARMRVQLVEPWSHHLHGVRSPQTGEANAASRRDTRR